MLRLKEQYYQEVLPKLRQSFGYKNNWAAPRIVKAVVNTGVNPDSVKEETRNEIIKALGVIAGQKPAIRPARKSIAGFKIREGSPVGINVTLRGQKMNDFLDRLIHIALPRTRDFRGLNLSAVDQNGNLNIGIKEQIIFPEISAETAKNIFGLQVTVATTAKSKKEGEELFRLMGFPLKKAL